MTTDTLQAVAKALSGDLEGEDLYYHPDKPSPNQLMRSLPAETVETAMQMILALRK